MTSVTRHEGSTQGISKAKVVGIGLAIAVVLATFVALFASAQPDGLERVAVDTGFAATAQDSPTSGSPLADYQVGGADAEAATWRSVGAGAAGVIIMAGVAFIGFSVLTRKSSSRQTDR